MSRAEEGDIFPGLLIDVPLLSDKPGAESQVNLATTVAGSPKGDGSPSGTGCPANLGQRTENQGFGLWCARRPQVSSLLWILAPPGWGHCTGLSRVTGKSILNTLAKRLLGTRPWGSSQI